MLGTGQTQNPRRYNSHATRAMRPANLPATQAPSHWGCCPRAGCILRGNGHTHGTEAGGTSGLGSHLVSRALYVPRPPEHLGVILNVLEGGGSSQINTFEDLGLNTWSKVTYEISGRAETEALVSQVLSWCPNHCTGQSFLSVARLLPNVELVRKLTFRFGSTF